ncbi:MULTISPECIES: O-methyltransferase [Aeromicrobium]|uniref:O-methyltransferase n=1 Tax=Aeromicrobium TaxID=2040 RepID=UPI000AFA4A53|nr:MULTISPECIES: O-methyltransferase [Aeromicrobium]
MTTATEEPTITTAASLAYAEDFLSEDDHLVAARRRSDDVGVIPVGPGGGAALSFLASVVQAKSVAEIGTGTGVSGLWLLRGMQPDGVLTSVDLEAEHQRLARETFTEAGYAPQRFRLIAGAGLDVMPRLTDAGYDVVFLDGDKVEYGEYLDQAMRLVRPGGIIVFDNALWHDRVADPAQRDPETSAIRDVVQRVRNDERLRSVLLPLGDGLLAAQLLA